MRIKQRLFSRKLIIFGLVCALLINCIPVASADEIVPSVFDLYTAPTILSDTCGSFAEGDSVMLLDPINNFWSRVRLTDGTTGYCDTSLLGTMSMTYESEADPKISTVRTCTAAAVHQSPDPDSAVLARLPANTFVNILTQEMDGFSLILLQNGKMGYISEDDLHFQYEQPALVRTIPTFPTVGAVTEEEAAERLQQLSAYFQHGLYWNCVGTGQPKSKDNLFLLTENPCNHPSRGYSCCNIYTGALCKASSGYSMATQCFGYANLLSDLVFGTEAPVYTHGDFDRIRVGDHIRLVLWDHSMVVTEVCKDENGKTYFYATDVNADYNNCMIQWGRKFTQSDLRRLGDYIRVQTRYPSEP